ncbi:hypothetical protein [Fischerella sp. NIES-3754]|uniref:hypothetical protein n=1 Tax=Fischerella sp. NIES-3754 TaxID=1752063 RepID=UPI000AF37D7E|nr:hypothetical protein [Fischerella sp. NIES-3754]
MSSKLRSLLKNPISIGVALYFYAFILMVPLLVLMVILHCWLVERSPANQS